MARNNAVGGKYSHFIRNNKCSTAYLTILCNHWSTGLYISGYNILPFLSRLRVRTVSVWQHHLAGLCNTPIVNMKDRRLLLDNVSIYPAWTCSAGLSLSLSLSLSRRSITQQDWRLHHSLGAGGVSGGVAGWEELTCELVGGSPAPGQHVLRRDTGASSASSEVGGERTYGHTQLHKH